ncbi:MAG: hypothetical protein JXR77_02555 [Lentisphaeria bacterium]|nr:hypothetical protein [Lentisphaeria bacterium]
MPRKGPRRGYIPGVFQRCVPAVTEADDWGKEARVEQDSDMALWDPIPDPGETTITRAIGPLELQVRRHRDEWHLAIAYHPHGNTGGNDPHTASEAGAASQSWRRWVVQDGSGGLGVVPVMPDRAVVVRPEFPIVLPPAEKATFYVSVPVWMRVVALPGDRALLDAPTVVLSKIWFGDFAAGELCYSIKSRARRHLAEDDAPGGCLAVCPVEVTNASPRDLALERLCIHVPYVGIFAGDGRLWTSHVSVSFEGDEQTAQVRYQTDAPSECSAPVERSKPRRTAPGRLSWRSLWGLPFLSTI